MKFITTDKHPELKEGVVFRLSKSRNDMYVSKISTITYIAAFDLDVLIEKNYIKGVEEKEFTRTDIAHAVYTAHHSYRGAHMNDGEAKEFVTNWLKQRDK